MNKTILVGNLGRDPEMQYTPSGQPVTRFSLATTRKYTVNGETRDETTWFDVTAWAKLAETCNQYLSKGSKVLIEGRVSLSEWDSQQDGKHHAKLVLTATSVEFLSPKPVAAVLGSRE